MGSSLDYRDIEDEVQALNEFEKLIEELREADESEDYTILTLPKDYEFQADLLQIIEREELEHRIELGGVIHVTIG